ncbi:MAG: flagellar hook-length control protein FliK [Pseudomonadota bacterium]
MSAKTVLTETPVSSSPVSNSNASAAAAPGENPTDFQNLLAGAGAPLEPSLIDPLPTQPLAQLLLVKNPVQPKTAAGTNTPVAPLPMDVSPEAMLKILDEAATLLPDASESGADAVIKAQGEVELEIPEELLDTDELSESADADWMELMTPSVFAPQAGSNNPGDASQGAQGQGGDGKAAQGTPISLMRQALVPEQLTPVDVAPPGSSAAATAGVKPDMIAAAQNPVTAFAAALTAKTDGAEKDKPSADGWMSALGDLAAKRGPEVAPAAGPRLSTPVHDARWADALSHRLVMMARDGESTASLKLVPVDLGPLDIQITVRDGEASVHFGAAHPETRNVLEASLPRLRELLGAQGLQLSNASVSHQSGGQNRSEKSSGPAAVGALTEDAEVAGAKAISTSLLDIYA